MNMCLRRSFVAVFVVMMCSFGTAVAEDQPLRGRLPDGRAFRTDAQGIQIVDYIAELELSIEALNRRIRGLEDELKEKSNSACGVPVKKDLAERDLLGGNNTTGNNGAVAPVVVMKNNNFQGGQNQSIDDLRARLSQCEAKIATQPIIPNADQRKTTDDLKWKLAQCEVQNKEIKANAAKQKNACLKVNSAQVAKEVAKYKNNLDVAKLEVKSCISKQELLIKRIKDLEALNYQNSKEGKEKMASFKDRPVNLTHQAVRDELTAEYRRLQILVNRRSALFAKYQKDSQNIKVKLSPLRSSYNRNLDSIKYGIQYEENLQALNMLRVDINQISKKVQDDINLLLRLNK